MGGTLHTGPPAKTGPSVSANITATATTAPTNILAFMQQLLPKNPPETPLHPSERQIKQIYNFLAKHSIKKYPQMSTPKIITNIN
jgi:hypothetical protein